MMAEWYQIPVFYFSNPAGAIGPDEPVWAPLASQALDFELEIACIIGQECRDVPADDRALEVVAGFTIMNDWSARDLQRAEMAIGLGPSKSKDFATSLGPVLVSFDELRDCYRDGRLHLAMTAAVNGKTYSRGDAGSMYWTWPQILAHASRDTELRPGDPYDRGKAELDMKRIKDFMGFRGHQTIVEQQLYEVPGQPGLVQVHYEVMNDTGTQKRVGRVMGSLPSCHAPTTFALDARTRGAFHKNRAASRA